MALLETLKQFNWVDILFVILLLRTCYIAVKNGFPSEFFRLLGIILATYLSLHYYINFSDYINSFTGKKNAPPEYLTLITFLVLVVAGYLLFALLGRLVSRFIQLEAVPVLNKWGSFILAIVRSFLLVSLIIFIFVIAPGTYFKNSVANSYSGKRLFKIAPATYTWLWDSVMSKFMAQEKFNGSVLKVQPNLTKK
jgi:membrane protein required for colicin V production